MADANATCIKLVELMPQLNLVYTYEVNYTESGKTLTDLNHLDEVGDLDAAGKPIMDEVFSLRNTYHADLVSLIVSSGDYCGTSNETPSATVIHSEDAFSVVNQQ